MASQTDHVITIEANPNRVIVTAMVTQGSRTIAETDAALTLREAEYPPVLYIPRGDVDMAQLERTDHSSHCPHKGDASYFSIRGSGETSVNAAWSYETPKAAVAAIRDHLAFYPDRVDAIVEQPRG